jgi:type I restriction enzyme M protein
VEQDAIESVILLPENLFFNTSAPGIIVVATKAAPGQPRPHAGEMLLINASKFFVKGRPKNEMTDAQVAQVGALFLDWRAEPDVSIVVSQAEVVRNDYNLSPSRYVASNDADAPLPLEDALVLLDEAEEARAAADGRLGQVLAALGLRDKPGFSEKPGL